MGRRGRLKKFRGKKSRFKNSVSDPDPFESVSFWSAGSGSASMKRTRIWVAKINLDPGSKSQPKSLEYIIYNIEYFFKTIKLMFTDVKFSP